MEEKSPIKYYIHYVKQSVSHFWEFPEGTLLVDSLTTKLSFLVTSSTHHCVYYVPFVYFDKYDLMMTLIVFIQLHYF